MTDAASPLDQSPDQSILESLMAVPFTRGLGDFSAVALVPQAIKAIMDAKALYGQDLPAYLQPRLGEILGACLETVIAAPARGISEVEARIAILKIIPTEHETGCDLVGGVAWLSVDDLKRALVTISEDLERLI